MTRPKLIVFASGSKTGGGSGFENLVVSVNNGILDAEIMAVVSNHANGGVRQRANKLQIPFYHMTKPFTAEAYQDIVKKFSAKWIALSGWLKLVCGLPPEHTFNIHPGPLPEFGGQGMYGHHVHEAVLKAFLAGQFPYSAITMHFVDEAYDRGPTFFQKRVPIYQGDTADTLAERVNETEHAWQPYITDLIVNGHIRYENGKVIVPGWYTWFSCHLELAV
ncbi:phosphoribosylglycinamide formyltransferase [Patescibacteria group bacterium]|nr:phosphoribosylglycinamide formyltransferase [Patescibacteria group bacterium]